MDKSKIKTLLNKWVELIDTSKQISIKKASNAQGGLLGRIKRTTGKPVIFDSKTYDEQKTIQKSLCEELPKWADIITSQPQIMDGYPWIRKDFIELYFSHFDLVVEKLQRIVDQYNE